MGESAARRGRLVCTDKILNTWEYQITHSATVTGRDKNGRLVLQSKMGVGAEGRHYVEDVPPSYKQGPPEASGEPPRVDYHAPNPGPIIAMGGQA